MYNKRIQSIIVEIAMLPQITNTPRCLRGIEGALSYTHIPKDVVFSFSCFVGNMNVNLFGYIIFFMT